MGRDRPLDRAGQGPGLNPAGRFTCQRAGPVRPPPHRHRSARRYPRGLSKSHVGYRRPKHGWTPPPPHLPRPSRRRSRRSTPRIEPEDAADQEGGRLRLEFGQRRVGDVLVEDGVSEFVRQGLDSLDGVVPRLDPDPPQAVVAVPVRCARELGSVDREPQPFGPGVQRTEPGGRVLTLQVATDHGQRVALGLGDVEYRHRSESVDRSPLLAVGLAGWPADQGSEDPDGSLPLDDRASELLPGRKARDPSGFRMLGADQQRIVEAVLMKPSLDLEVGSPPLRSDQGFDPFGQGVKQTVTFDCPHQVTPRSSGADCPIGAPGQGLR